MEENAFSCIAQVRNGPNVFGAGFLVPGNHVMTCAHVVNLALNRAHDSADQPGPDDNVELAFPWATESRHTYVGRVVRWSPMSAEWARKGHSDIAVLAVDPAPPTSVRPAWLQNRPNDGPARIHTAGFPVGHVGGRPAQGLVKGNDADGWLHVVSSAEDLTFDEGHSGAPVFLDSGGTVIAMVAMIESSRRDSALLIPVAFLQQLWPELAEPSSEILADNPYRGLETFNTEHRALFKGRDGATAMVRKRLRERTFVVVVGPSGSGKSSLALAGVLPAYADEQWLTVSFRPTGDPFQSFALSIAPHLAPSQRDPGDVWKVAKTYAQNFQASSQEILGVLRHLVASTGTRGILIVIDQLEELFTEVSLEEKEKFVRFLEATCEEGGTAVNVLATLRADFLGQALCDARLTCLFQDADFKLGPLSEVELRQAIELPARARGVRFAPGLVDRLIGDTIGHLYHSPALTPETTRQAGRLPLLEFALAELWRRQQGGEISHAAYSDQLVGIGGLEGALRNHADSVYRDLGRGADGTARQERARRLFRRLVRRHQGGVDIRRLVPRSEVEADWNDVVVELARARLVVTSEAEPSLASVEVVHEELLRAWPNLAQWIAESHEFDLWREALNTAAERWKNALEGEKSDLLLRGSQLDKALELLQERRTELNEWEIKFVEAGRSERSLATEIENSRRLQEQRRRNRVLLIFLIALTVLLGMLVVALFYWVIESKRANGAFNELTKVTEKERRTTAQLRTVLANAEREQGDPVRAVLLSLDALPKEMDVPTATPNLDGVERALWAAWQASHERSYLSGHKAPVFAVAWSKPAGVVVSASADRKIRLWNPDTSQLVREFEGHTKGLSAIALSPDGRRLASGSFDRSVRIWNLDDHSSKELKGHEGDVLSVSWSFDGKFLASTSSDTTVRVWNADSGTEVKVLQGHRAAVRAVAWSYSGRHLASVADDRSLLIWDSEKNTKLQLDGGDNFVRSLAWSPDDRYLASASSLGAVRVWDSTDGALRVVKQHNGPVYAIAWNPYGTRLASAAEDGKVSISDVDWRQEITLLRHDTAVSALAWNPDGKRLATASANVAHVWDADRGERLASLRGHKGRVLSITWSADRQRIATGSEDHTVRIWDSSSPDTLATHEGHDDSVYGISWSNNGQRIASASYDGTVRIWNATDAGPPTTLREHGAPVSAVSWSPKGESVASASYDGTVRVWDAQSGKTSFLLNDHRDLVNAVAWTVDGEYLASASRDGILQVWKRGSDKKEMWRGHDSEVFALAWSCDGTLASASDDGTIKLWRLGYTTPFRILHGLAPPFRALAWDAGGKRLAGSGPDNAVQVWDAGSGAVMATLRGHVSPVYSVAWSPDGKRVASGSVDKTVRIWGLNQPESLAVIGGHHDAVTSVAWSSDGRSVASGSWDRTVRVWRVFDTLRGLQEAAQATLPAGHKAFLPEEKKLFQLDYDN